MSRTTKITKPRILLTNDDGIQSPGLWAAAAALASIVHVTVAAPAEQSSGMGRSLPSTSSGNIQEQKLRVNGQEWIVYAVSGLACTGCPAWDSGCVETQT